VRFVMRLINSHEIIVCKWEYEKQLQTDLRIVCVLSNRTVGIFMYNHNEIKYLNIDILKDFWNKGTEFCYICGKRIFADNALKEGLHIGNLSNLECLYKYLDNK